MLERPPTICSAVNGGTNCGHVLREPRRQPVEVDAGRRVRGHRVAYFPVKRGGRRSAIAATPSWKSEVRAQDLLLLVLAGRRRADAVGELAAHRLADRQDRERARRRDLARELARRVAQVLGAGETVAQPDGERFGALRLAAGVHQLERALLADDRGQRHRDAEALVEAELGEVAAEAGVRGGHAEVGREREAEAAAHRRALHRGDDRLASPRTGRRPARRGSRCCPRGPTAGRGRRRRRSSCPPSTARSPGSRDRRRARRPLRPAPG